MNITSLATGFKAALWAQAQKWNRWALAGFLLAGAATSIHAQVLNPGFETGNLTDWVYDSQSTINSTHAHSGTYCVAIAGGGSCLQTVKNLTPNTTYTLVGWGELSATCYAEIGVRNFDSSGTQNYVSLTTVGAYQQVAVNFTTGASNTSAVIWISNGNNQTTTVYGDDFSIGYFPDSDPGNTGNWIQNSSLSDEFNGTTLDTTKWSAPLIVDNWIGNEGSSRGEPGAFDPGNVSESGGLLHVKTVNWNQLVNGSFEHGSGDFTGWSAPSAYTTITNWGTYDSNGVQQTKNYMAYHACEITTTSTSGTQQIQQTISNLTPNTPYLLTAFMRTGPPLTGVKVTLGVSGYNGTASQSTSNTTDSWNASYLTFTPTSTTATITISDSGAPGSVYCDEISVVPSTLPTNYKWTVGQGDYVTTAIVASTTVPGYGYYEARLKASSGTSTSSFWLAGNGTYPAEEIDMCEMIGNPTFPPEWDPTRYEEMPMNTHYKGTSSGTNYTMMTNGLSYPYNLGSATDAAFHIYGVDWEANTITYYCDGVQVYQKAQSPTPPTANGQTLVQNVTYMDLFFDSEIWPGWGIPDPGTSIDFQVDYVRAWHH